MYFTKELAVLKADRPSTYSLSSFVHLFLSRIPGSNDFVYYFQYL